jgi:hypothetical protein
LTKEQLMPIRTRILAAVVALSLNFAPGAAQDPPALQTARGVVVKAEKDALTVKPRDAAGKFLPDLRLKLTGTSRVTTLSPQNRGGKTVLAQKDTDAASLQPKQSVAVIYAAAGADAVLLSAVVQP